MSNRPIPDALKDLENEQVWVAWNSQDGRKIPKSVHTGNASVNDRDTWGTYAQAARSADMKRYTGVGIMLDGGLVGIDLDHVIDENGHIADWAQDIIDQVGSYTETSPSGTGVHIIARADPAITGPIGRADHRKGIEVYNHGRYFTLTGNQLNDNHLADATDAVMRVVSDHFTGPSANDRVRSQVGAMASQQVRRMANRTMRKNASRDGVRFARVPAGAKTCAFCAMLASRGFVYHSEDKAGALDQYHYRCDCDIVPEFQATTIEGYDPEALYDDYSKARDKAGDNPTTSQILAEMRRTGKYTDSVHPTGRRIKLGENERITRVIGQDRVNALNDMLNKSPHKETAQLFASFFPEFEIVGTKLPKGARAHFNARQGGIFVNADEIDQPSAAHPPYNTFVHECSHMLDWKLGDGENRYFSTKPLNGYDLGVQLDADAENAVREKMKNQKGTPTERRRKAMRELVKEINSQLGDDHDWSIHDMFQASLIDGDDYARLSGFGHKYGYFNTKGNQQCEAFAEMMAAQLTDEFAWRTMEKYFPQATKLFDMMIREVSQ